MKPERRERIAPSVRPMVSRMALDMLSPAAAADALAACAAKRAWVGVGRGWVGRVWEKLG